MNNIVKDTMQLTNEYKLLRNEILYYMNKDTTLLTCLFSCVTAVLFFSFERNISEGCLLSFLIIIPICSKLAYHQKQMAKISVYMQHFLEPYLDIKWESFVRELSIHDSRPKYGRYLKFSECPIMAVASVLSYIYLAIENKLWENYQYIFALEIIVLTVLFIQVLITSAKIYKMKDYRTEYETKINTINI